MTVKGEAQNELKTLTELLGNFSISDVVTPLTAKEVKERLDYCSRWLQIYDGRPVATAFARRELLSVYKVFEPLYRFVYNNTECKISDTEKNSIIDTSKNLDEILATAIKILEKQNIENEQEIEKKRLDLIVNRAISAVQKEIDPFVKNGLIKSQLLRRISDILLASCVQELPNAPPDGRFYDQRPEGQSAPDFIEEVYGAWLTGEFTRADLRKIDPKAEMALRNWERQNGRSSLNLPTVKERNDQQLGVQDSPDQLDIKRRERMRLASAATRRRTPN